MPIRSDMMLCVVFGLGSLLFSSFSSAMNLLRTDMNRDWANVPITSAYKSAMMCIFAAFGPL
jgi:hypothetical protein